MSDIEGGGVNRILGPPRINSRRPEDQTRALLEWFSRFYGDTTQRNDESAAAFAAIEERLDAIEARQQVYAEVFNAIDQLGPLTQSIGSPPTQGQVEAIQTKVNQIIQLAGAVPPSTS